MLAECDLNNIAGPESYGNVAEPARSEAYAPTESLPPTGRLVFPGPRMQLRTQIVTAERRYSLRNIFVIHMSYLSDGSVFASHPQLPVHGSGPDQRSALSAFCDAFDFQWRNLVDVPEVQLTKGAQKRRQLLHGAVDKVEEIAVP